MFYNAIKDRHRPEVTLPSRDARKALWDTLPTQSRPHTAVHRKSTRKQPALLAAKLGPLARPNTAPALLTGEGLIVKRPHENDFLQRLENQEVINTISHQRKEKLTQIAWIQEYDLPAHPITEGSRLYELSLYHGATQRSHNPLKKSKSEATTTAVRTQATNHCAGQLHDLSRALDGNLCHHLYRLGLPVNTRTQNTGFLFDAADPKSRRTTVVADAAAPHFGGSSDSDRLLHEQFMSECSELFRASSAGARRPALKRSSVLLTPTQPQFQVS